MKKSLKVSSLILITALLFQSVTFVQANSSNADPNSAAKGKGNQTIISEDVSKRGDYERHFKLADGKYIAETYTEPVNKQKNGQWVSIDNTLSESTDNNGKSILKNKDGLMDVAFAQDPGNDDLVSITQDIYSVTWNMKAKSNEVSSDNISTTDNAIIDNTTSEIDSTVSDDTPSTSSSSQAGDSANSIIDDFTSSTADSTVGSIDSDTYVTDNSDIIDLNPDASAQVISTDISGLTDEQKMTAALTAGSAVQYSNILPNTDLFYNITPTMVKENIVLKDKSDVTSYDVEMKIKELTAILMDDGSIQLCDASGNLVFTVAAPYMYDSGIMSGTRNKYSYDITVQLTQINKNKVCITYTPSYDWLNDPDRVYPVTIDPTITQKGQNPQTQDTYVPFGDAAVHGAEPYLYVGVNCWSYVKFTLPSLGANCLMSNAQIFMYAQERLPVNVYPITSAWDSNTLKGTNSPGYGSIILTGVYPNALSGTSSGWYEYRFTIDDLAAGGYSGTHVNQGILLTADADPGRWWWITASDATSSPQNPTFLPALQVTYYTSADVNLTNGIYFVKNNWSGRYLDVCGAVTANGIEVWHYSFNGGVNQQWYIQNLGNGEYSFQSNLNRSYVIDINNGNLSPGQHLEIWQNNGGYNQKFRILRLDADGSIVIMPSYTNCSVIDADMTTGSTYVLNWRFLPGMSNQRWTVEWGTTTSGVKGIQTTSSGNINCIAYAFFLPSDTFANSYFTGSDAAYCESTTVDNALTRTKTRMTSWLNANFPGKWREVSSYDTLINAQKEWLVCMRVGVGYYSGCAYAYDYHFWYRANNGTWYNKHGTTGSSEQVSGNVVNPSTANTSNGWELYGSYYYKSSTVYYVISE